MNELGALARIKAGRPAVNRIRYTTACDKAPRSNNSSWLSRLTRGCGQVTAFSQTNREAAVWLIQHVSGWWGEQQAAVGQPAAKATAVCFCWTF